MIGVALAGSAVMGQARAQPATPPPASPITDHLALAGSYFFGDVATSGRVDSPSAVPGTPFSAESDFGLPARQWQPLPRITLRFADRNRLRVDFLDLRRHGQAMPGVPLQFGAQTFTPGQTLQSELDWRETGFTYTYSVLRSSHYEFGAGVGLHLIDTQATVQASGTAQSAQYSAAGPYLTLALDGTWLLARRWSLNARAQYLRLTVDGSRGQVGTYAANLQYRWLRNVALGAGYRYQRIDVDLTSGSPTGRVGMRLDGPELFVRVAF